MYVIHFIPELIRKFLSTQIVAPPERKYSVWIGGSILVSFHILFAIILSVVSPGMLICVNTTR